MAPRATVYECGPVSAELSEFRLLTEVHQLQSNLDEIGNVPTDVEAGVEQNLETYIAEISMPYAVTTTTHRVEYVEEEGGIPRRVITWLGKNAVRVAEGGHDFHFSSPGHARVGVEVAEAAYNEETLDNGNAKVFISPKMSRRDASYEIAKAEHLADDDSIRVSTPVRDVHGTVIGRRLQSLLVREIPLESWVAMLKDKNNIFERAFELEDEQSALSVMKLFAELELPESALPDGPVTIVEAVLPYIQDEGAKAAVQEQIIRFRNDQKLYADEAKRKAKEWYDFDLELARSLKNSRATYEVRNFIITLQHDWSDADLIVLENHSIGNSHYGMSNELAAVLEKKKRLLLGRAAAVVTNNDRAMKAISAKEQQDILHKNEAIRIAQQQGIAPEQIRQMQANMDRQVARTNIKVGGGCAGDVNDDLAQGIQNKSEIAGVKGLGKEDKSDEDAKDVWKEGVCQIPTCPSPKPTKVGPCSICKHCQAEFDAGRDPTAPAFVKFEAPKVKIAKSITELLGMKPPKPSS